MFHKIDLPSQSVFVGLCTLCHILIFKLMFLKSCFKTFSSSHCLWVNPEHVKKNFNLYSFLGKIKLIKFLLGNSISSLICVWLFGANRNAIPLILFNSDSVFGTGNKSKMFRYALIHLSPLEIWIVISSKYEFDKHARSYEKSPKLFLPNHDDIKGDFSKPCFFNIGIAFFKMLFRYWRRLLSETLYNIILIVI